MKTLLYNVSHREDMKNIGFVPLAYVLLEEYLRKMEPDMEFFRYDYIPDDPEAKEFENYFHYDLVGFQLTYPNINVVLEMVERWHKAEDKPFVVLGGVLASAIAFELVENHQFIDAVVIGEGEESLLQLTHYLEGKIELSQVPGIVYRDQQDKATFNRGKRPIDFDLTAIPKRDYLAQLPQEEARRTSVRIQSARGCLGGCSFCMNSYKNRLDKVTTKSWRGMSPQRVIQEIESLYHRFGIQIINFVDPSFEDPGKRGKERIAEIAKLLVEKDLRISFKVNMRAKQPSHWHLTWMHLQAYSQFLHYGYRECADRHAF